MQVIPKGSLCEMGGLSASPLCPQDNNFTATSNSRIFKKINYFEFWLHEFDTNKHKKQANYYKQTADIHFLQLLLVSKLHYSISGGLHSLICKKAGTYHEYTHKISLRFMLYSPEPIVFVPLCIWLFHNNFKLMVAIYIQPTFL